MTTESADVVVPARRGRWWRWAQFIFLGVGLVYAVAKIAEEWAPLRAGAAELHPDWSMLLEATVIVFAVYAALIQSWRVLVAGWGSALRYLPAVRIWTIANLGRYIPGKVWSVAALGRLAQEEGVSGTAAAGSAILGTLINIGAGFGVVAISGSALQGVSVGYRYGATVGCVLFVAGVIAMPWLLPPVATWLSRRLGRPLPNAHLPARPLWVAVTINVLSWLGYGSAFMVFARACNPAMHGTLAQFVAVWTASYLAGYIAFFAPGGIGAREVTMIASLVALGIASPAEATLLSVASRLWLTVLELLPGLVALALSPAVRRARLTNSSHPRNGPV